ncbi:MAG: thioredoxin-dependent thiol peroxidase [Pyrinomonadaceae bacterium]
MLKEGDKAPSFSGKNQDGKTIKLADFKGRKLALYFYPRDMTPGCTKEANSIRDGYSDLNKKQIAVVGVSTDDEAKHQKFIEKYELPFMLIADTEHAICDKYGVWVEKNMYGKKYMGIKRTTFLIDETGSIKKIFKKVNVSDHANEILAGFSE